MRQNINTKRTLSCLVSVVHCEWESRSTYRTRPLLWQRSEAKCQQQAKSSSFVLDVLLGANGAFCRRVYYRPGGEVCNAAKQGKSVDMRLWLQCYAFDVIGHVTVS